MKSIVIIDDDADTLDVYYELLTQEQYRVFPTGAGRLGLKVIRQELPHLVILDLLIPGDLNGMSVLKELKKDVKTKHIPILVITNHDGARETIVAAGASRFLTKAKTSIDMILDEVRTLTKDFQNV